MLTSLCNILQANNKITSDVDSHFWLKFTHISVGMQDHMDADAIDKSITPHECRLQTTYSAPFFVMTLYTCGKHLMNQASVSICRIPVLLRSNKCVLTGKSEKQLARMNECPLNPWGDFVVKGMEKVILVQEQLSKNGICLNDGSPHHPI